MGALAALAAMAGTGASASAGGERAPSCAPGGEPVVLDGEVGEDEGETYLLLPFEVAEGTTRVEVGYEWADLEPGGVTDGGEAETRTVIDLGLWDEDGTEGYEAFRGWSGSRQGKVAEGQDPVFVQADEAERGYVAGPVEPGTWHVELGLAFVAPGGASYEATVTCTDPEVGEASAPDPVDPDLVADPEPGWYVGDLHLHARHSNPEGLDGPAMVEAAVDAGLDFVPVTEYVTPAHWTQLGQVQEEHPDVVLWPGREVITYDGHAIVLGETISTVEHRQGFEGASLGAVQEASRTDGALFGIAHPTFFPGEEGAELCRGCHFDLAEQIEWSEVDTLEVVTGSALFDSSFEPADPGGGGGGTVENPFVATALDLWDERLLAGDHIAAVGGSDDKEGDRYGSAATAVHAEQLSRDALADALQAGRAYVLARGTTDSPELELVATAPDGAEVTFGETLVADTAEVELTVAGAEGQSVRVVRNGEEVDVVEVDADPFTATIDADRDPASEGPLGTYWRVEVFDDASRTAIANPVFLADGPHEAPERPEPTFFEQVQAGADDPDDPDEDDARDGADVVETGPNDPWWALLGALAAATLGGAVAYAVTRRRRRDRPPGPG